MNNIYCLLKLIWLKHVSKTEPCCSDRRLTARDIRVWNIEHIPMFFLFYSENENFNELREYHNISRYVTDIVQTTIYKCKKIFEMLKAVA
jgi:hypothetical protein